MAHHYGQVLKRRLSAADVIFQDLILPMPKPRNESQQVFEYSRFYWGNIEMLRFFYK